MKDNNTDYQNDNSCNNSNISLSMAVISVILQRLQQSAEIRSTFTAAMMI